MPTMEKKKLSKTALKKAQKVLQTAHDYHEEHGFNVAIAADKTLALDEYKKGRKGKINMGACCFIGGTRLAAGTNPHEFYLGTDYGDGKELTDALTFLDNAAQNYIKKKNLTGIINYRRRDPFGVSVEYEPGGWAEGLANKFRYNDNFSPLQIYRDALRLIHEQLEA